MSVYTFRVSEGNMNEPTKIVDSFYGECLVIGEIPDGSKSIRVALVNKGSLKGIDIRKFKKDGTPTKGVLISDSKAVKSLIELLENSTEVEEFLSTGEIDLSN